MARPEARPQSPVTVEPPSRVAEIAGAGGTEAQIDAEIARVTAAFAQEGITVLPTDSPGVIGTHPEGVDLLGEIGGWVSDRLQSLKEPRVALPVASVLGALSLACGPAAEAKGAPPKQLTVEAGQAKSEPAAAEKPAGEVLGGGPVTPPEAGAGKDAKAVPQGADKPAPQPDRTSPQGIPILTDAEIEKLATVKLREIARNARDGQTLPQNEADGFARWWERNADKIRPPEGQRPLATLPVIPREQIPGKIKELKDLVSPFRERPPLDPAITQDAWGMRIGGIEDYLNQAEETLAKGEIEKTRELLKRVDNLIFIMGAGAGDTITDDDRKQHDPEGKYIPGSGNRPIRPEVKNPYLRITDLRRAVDKLD